MLIGLGQAELPAGDRGEFTVTQSWESYTEAGGWNGFRVGAVTALSVLLWPLLPSSSDLEGFWLSVKYSVAAIHIFSVALCSEIPIGRNGYLSSYQIEWWLPTVVPREPSLPTQGRWKRCRRRIMTLLGSMAGNKIGSFIWAWRKITLDMQGQKSHAQREDMAVK